MEVREDRDLFDTYLLTLQIEELTSQINDLKDDLKKSEKKLEGRLMEQAEKVPYSNPVIAGKTLGGKLFLARLDDDGVIIESFDLCPNHEEEA